MKHHIPRNILILITSIWLIFWAVGYVVYDVGILIHICLIPALTSMYLIIKS